MENGAGTEARIPVSLLTGFLGSGKTTLLNQWLKDPTLANAAVIVNEFGEIGIDHTLIASSNENTIELSTGCLCCSVQGDLVETLRELKAKRNAGKVPPFSRILIETTGLADVVPVIQALMTFPVARSFRLNRVITVVDAVNGLSTLRAHAEATRQVAVADALIISKVDLLEASTEALSEALTSLNPGATRSISSAAAPPDASMLDGPDIYSPLVKPEEAHQWLKADRYLQHSAASDGYIGHLAKPAQRHAANVGSFCITFDEALPWTHVSAWLDALVIAHPDELLRVKGILHLEDHPYPIVVQAVQRLFHPPAELRQWPTEDRRSQIVFITKGLTKDYVLEVLRTVRCRTAA